MTGIVFEGGTFRPIFSCGVMDALLSENILLPYCIGVSAGIADGVSYISCLLYKSQSPRDTT